MQTTNGTIDEIGQLISKEMRDLNADSVTVTYYRKDTIINLSGTTKRNNPVGGLTLVVNK